MEITHEIYHCGAKCGSAIEFDDKSLSITVEGRFMGIYSSFDLWNPGDYTIRRIVRMADSKKIEYDYEEYDLYGMNWGFVPTTYED